MYQIVIAEDDERMRLVVEKIIPWDKDSYNICCSCSNGPEAKEYIDNYPVDVAILDINIPLMNGLDLARYIYENYPKIQVVLISAYKEFEYARQAVEYDVVDYITKPITKSSIERSFGKVKKRLESRDINKFVNDNIIIKRQQLFFGIMNNCFPESQKDLLDQLKRFDINIDPDNYPCAKLNMEIEQYDTFIKSVWHRDKEAFYEALQKIITTDYLQSYFSVLSTDENHIEIVVISKQSNNPDFDACLDNDIICLKNNIKDIVNINVKVIKEKVCDNINQYLDSQKNDDRIKNQILFTMNHLINGEKEMMLQSIKDAQKIILSEEGLAAFYKKLIIRFEECLEYSEKKFVKSEYFSANFIKDIEKLKEETIKLAEKTFDILFNNIGENAIIEEAQRYIYENYTKDLSLQEVAERVSLNSCYFSSVFKKYVGIGFSAYLTQVRMNKAKELLENTNLKTQAIAAEVGFKEVTYFYRIFRGITGKTPTEYRMEKNQ